MARKLRPILGFGWAGWTAAVVLAGLIVASWVGVDFEFLLLRLIFALFGIDGVNGFTNYYIIWHLFAFRRMQFSLITMLYTLVAMHAARRRSWWWHGAVIAWGVIGPSIPPSSLHAAQSFWLAIGGSPLSTAVWFDICDFLSLGVTACLLGFLTRSKLVTGIAVVAVVSSGWAERTLLGERW